MRAHYLQHVPFEGLGGIEEWLAEQNAGITVTQFFEPEASLPELDGIDLLIIMGGPMSVNDEDEYPWLLEEKAFIRSAIEAGKPVLGVCLGAQAMAAAMGSRVHRGPAKEIGWFPVTRAGEGEGAFAFPETIDVFHWHGETFDLPEGAVHLASSEVVENQAFQLGERAIGLQFHLETTPATARALLTHCNDELVLAPYIQTAERILSAPPERYEAVHALTRELLEYLTRD